ncbi:B12-binding domain-containing protein [Bacillus daqingensis]|uniref:B12-binding domain-containing protein n=1 Tax=Bacillus daqingensis TaxID=872396 RepID=A0ABV9NVY9_9BACI
MNNKTQAFTEALLDGDHGAAFSIVRDVRRENGRLALFQDLITPSMYTIGYKWEQGDITVAEEHLATGVCDFVLTQLEYELVSQSKQIDADPKALFFSMENEKHYLGLKMVSILFRERGWNVKFLQSDLPVELALEEASRWNPSVIGLSFSLSYRAEELSRYLEGFHKQSNGADILVGGRLVSKFDFSAIAAKTTFLKDLHELTAWFKTTERTGRDEANEQSNTTSVI